MIKITTHDEIYHRANSINALTSFINASQIVDVLKAVSKLCQRFPEHGRNNQVKNQPERRSTDLKDRESGVISLWIDSYDDIFSDFDPRPFSERTISDDFVVQMKRVSRGSRGKVAVLKLLVPEGTQKEDQEKSSRSGSRHISIIYRSK